MHSRARNARALAVGSLVGGLLAYVFFILATRSVGATDAASVALLWTYWSFAAAALTFPLQHWIARSIAVREAEGQVHDELPRVAIAVVVAALVAGLAAWLARDSLFHDDGPVFPLLVAGVTLGSGYIGVVRGGLAARDRFISLSVAIAGENAVRCLLAVALIAIGWSSPTRFGICMVLGPLIGLAWPSAVRFSADRRGAGAESAWSVLGHAAGGQLIAQAVLTGGPILLAWSGGRPSQVTALFAALALFRAPYTLSIGVVSQLTGWLTRLVTQQDHAALRRARLSIVGGGLVFTAASGLLGVVVGPYVLPLVFGHDVTLAAGPSVLVAVGSAMAVVNLFQTVSLIAHGRSRVIALAWLSAVPIGAAAFILLPLDALERTCWAFALTETAAFVVMVVAEGRGSIRLAPGGRLDPNPQV